MTTQNVPEPAVAGTPTLDKRSEDLHRRILTSVSHDLKTPLACIIGSLEIFERTKHKLSEDKKKTLIYTALHEAYRLNGFITNILDMARLEGGAVSVKKEWCDIVLLLEDCRLAMLLQSPDSVITISGLEPSFMAMTDPMLLTRAVCILLDNSIKYSPKEATIHIEYAKIEGMNVIRVLDNGSGIPEIKHEEIFSKYSRFAMEDHIHSGTGLGLPICREVMRLLDGTVSVTNRTGMTGTIFTLAFPE